MVDVNWLAVLVSGVASMIIGSIWYGPLFGKQWVALMGITPAQIEEAKKGGAKGMAKSYTLAFIGSVITAWVLSYIIAYAAFFMGTEGVTVGLSSGFWAWLGFVVPVQLSSVLWEGKPWKLFCIYVGYYLVQLLAIGAIIGAWI